MAPSRRSPVNGLRRAGTFDRISNASHSDFDGADQWVRYSSSSRVKPGGGKSLVSRYLLQRRISFVQRLAPCECAGLAEVGDDIMLARLERGIDPRADERLM